MRIVSLSSYSNVCVSYKPSILPDAETLRFDVVDSNGGNTGAVEIAVYGEFIED